MTQSVAIEGGPDQVEAYLRERGMTDGLPIIPPTPERVGAAVAASGLPAEHVVSDVPPLNAPATVEKIAVNAVMAGCSPGAMPVLIAAIDAFCDPQMNAHGVQTTTNPVGPMLVVNGPIRNQMGFNFGAGCFGPGSHTNATVGRALRLALVNIGGATPGEVDKAPLGWPGKATSLCVAENEEASPWPPYHTDMGFDADEDVVTVLAVNGMWPITDMHHEPEQVLHHVTHGLAISGPCGGHDAPNPFPTVLVMSRSSPRWCQPAAHQAGASGAPVCRSPGAAGLLPAVPSTAHQRRARKNGRGHEERPGADRALPRLLGDLGGRWRGRASVSRAVVHVGHAHQPPDSQRYWGLNS